MRRPWIWVLVAFAATRLLMGFVANDPSDFYPEGKVDTTSDIANYAVWGNQMQDFHHWPWRDFTLEYPPGALVVANVPYWISHEHFHTAFVIECLVVDGFGLLACYRLAARRRTWWGVAYWLVFIPALGPVAYSRLDIVVAAILAWAIERAEAGRWTTAGVWLGLGVAAKLTPALLVPALVVAAPRRFRVAIAVAVAAGVFVLPFLGELSTLYDSAVKYHMDRGVHIESLWGSLALLVRVLFDADIGTVAAFGAADLQATVAPRLKLLANLAAFGVLVDSALLAATRVRRGDGTHLAIVMASTSALLVGVGRVFSPQYLVWVVAPMAMALAIAPRALRWAAASLALGVVLAHVVYPFVFLEYINVLPTAIWIGVIRNVAILVAGVLAARVAWRFASGLPAVEEHEVVEPGLAHVVVGPEGKVGDVGAQGRQQDAGDDDVADPAALADPSQ